MSGSERKASYRFLCFDFECGFLGGLLKAQRVFGAVERNRERRHKAVLVDVDNVYDLGAVRGA